jgi:hypothetical protein
LDVFKQVTKLFELKQQLHGDQSRDMPDPSITHQGISHQKLPLPRADCREAATLEAVIFSKFPSSAHRLQRMRVIV